MSFSKLFSVQFLVICVAVFAVAFGLSVLLTEDNTEPIRSIESPTEIALIYVGCSTCSAATDERITGILENLSDTLEKTALSKGYEFSFIGISNEYNVTNGLEYLTDIASFDEIALGNGMENTAIQHYVWDHFDNALSASAPQIIVSRRSYDTQKTNSGEFILADIISEEILARRVGVQRMAQFTEQKNAFRFL
jgi:hypothetical protein